MQAFVTSEGPAHPASTEFTTVTYNTRSVFPNANTTTIAVISIALEGIDMQGSPFSVISEYISPYFAGDTRIDHQLLRFHVTFNFNGQKNISAYAKLLKELIRDIKL